MEVWSQQLHHIEAARRRVYAAAAALAALAQAGVIVLDIHLRHWSDLPSTAMGMLVAVTVLLAVTRWKLRMEVLNRTLAGLAAVAILADILPFTARPVVGTQAYLSFLLLTTLWFGLLPLRPAAYLSAGAYVGFAALVLTRPTPEVPVVAYLAGVTGVVGLAAAFGQQLINQQRQTAEFQVQSLTDVLTSLPNRRAAQRRLDRLWTDRLETSGCRSFALLMIDLDRFKAINDRYSHTIGDQVLTATGPALRALLGPDDVLARWGGEEFMLILPDTDARRAYETANRLDGVTLTLPGTLPAVTFSAGAALSHEAGSLEELLALVDRRMHAAKDAGRQQVRWDARPLTLEPPAPLH